METHAEENYLKAIYKISEHDPGSVSTKVLAGVMNSKPSSVTDMIQRLSVKELVDYKKYKGFSLTEKGRKKALHIIRKHRLWELFLVKHLNFSWEEVHDIAEQLEHISSLALVNRLDAFLDFPRRDPHGDIIPDENGHIRVDDSIELSKLMPNQTCWVTCIKNASTEFLIYLDQVGIAIDTEIIVLEQYAYDHSMKVSLDGGKDITLSEKVINNLFVRTKKMQANE